MAAHLAGAVAAHTTLPVVGVPISSGALNGVDALYATVQMPPGIPVATVAIDGSKNAALLVVQMLAISDEDLARQLAALHQGTRELGRSHLPRRIVDALKRRGHSGPRALDNDTAPSDPRDSALGALIERRHQMLTR